MNYHQIFELVFYHTNCPDGQTSAWVYKQKMKELNLNMEHVIFVPIEAGKYPIDIDIANKKILMIDVCPKRDEIVTITSKCEYLYILDHHESGKRDVENLDEIKNLCVIFDMDRSGCQIAWDYFFPYTIKSLRKSKNNDFYWYQNPIENDCNYLSLFKNMSHRPWFVDITGDRDLWKFEYRYTKPISAYLHFYEYYNNEIKMDSLLYSNEDEIYNQFTSGINLLNIEKKEIDDIVSQSVLANFDVLGISYKVHFVMCKYTLCSDVGNILSKKDCDFAVMSRYNFNTDEWVFSCRGNNKVNLSILCREFGGGGHFNAAGFSIKNEKGVLQRMFVKL